MDPEDLDRLLTPSGAAALDRCAGATDDVDPLELATLLRREFSAEIARSAQTLDGLRRRARGKFTRAERMWFTREGLEQATAEPVGRHRAARLGTAAPWRGTCRLWDLCCGIGGDLLTISDLDADVTAVDVDPVHLRMAALNARVYGCLPPTTLLADVRGVPLGPDDVVLIDPARRDGRGRMASTSEPPLDWVLAQAHRVAAMVVKARPGLAARAVPPGWEREIVSLDGTLREAALWSPALAAATVRATVLPSGSELTRVGPEPDVAVAAPGSYVLDPDPAVTRAGLVRDLADRLAAWQIDPEIAFLSADRPAPTPFGRWLRVVDSLPWHERRVGAAVAAAGLGVVDVRRRGLAGDTDTIARRLRGPGEQPGVVLMTRHLDQPWGVVCVEA